MPKWFQVISKLRSDIWKQAFLWAFQRKQSLLLFLRFSDISKSLLLWQSITMPINPNFSIVSIVFSSPCTLQLPQHFKCKPCTCVEATSTVNTSWRIKGLSTVPPKRIQGYWWMARGLSVPKEELQERRGQIL